MSQSVYSPVAAAILGIPLCRVSLRLQQGKGRSKGCGHDCDHRGLSPPLWGSDGFTEGSILLTSCSGCSGDGVQPAAW